ncbi:hypothetical protein D9756_000945 [Leucocoprinus leucothites]|uniref:Uncharacterized protein n=1 Tax=Leucocoprinus leucothites TaxID=201217 RepID=A0A8H5LNU5_9AGAR|nr:hypothetical protein D9756_000945 [Leucoagaricus leucothites]
MDVATDLTLPESHSDPGNALSYDDSVDYEHQIPTTAEEDPRSNLASRIGNTKIYLLSETSAAARNAKRKYEDDDEIIFDSAKRVKAASEDNEVEMEEASYRANAILLQGSPISHLPTARLFAYAKHFDTTPLGLEWVNDQTCVFVYESNSLARTAFTLIQKSALEDPDPDDFVTAKPIPVALWPAEARINQTLGKSEGLKGVLKMRWAKHDDVKKRGAKKESEFYKRHGIEAGKELFNGRDLPPAKRVRNDDSEHVVLDQDLERRRLDTELDQFLQDSDGDEPRTQEVDEAPASPPSKMRSDYIANDGRTLLDRFTGPGLFESDRNPAERLGLKDRPIMPLPRRARGGRGTRRVADDVNPDEMSGSGSLWERLTPADVDSDGSRRRGGLGRHNRDSRGARRRAGRGDDRPKMTQEELDAELDALRQE